MAVRYTKSDGLSLAYEILSEEGVPLIHVAGMLSNLAMDDGIPGLARYFERLARFCRVVRYDKRGTGLSDRSALPAPLERQVMDLDAIREAVGVERTALLGVSQGAPLAALYAIRFPERVTHLIWVDGMVASCRDPWQPLSRDNQVAIGKELMDLIDTDYDAFTQRWVELASRTTRAIGAEEAETAIAYLQASASPGAMRVTMESLQGMDIRDVLEQIQVPTLVIHARRDDVCPIEHGRYFAEHVGGARLLELDSNHHYPFLDEQVAPIALAAIEELLTGHVGHSADRVLATVVFTDIVASTSRQQAVGDEAWSGLRQRFEAESRQLVEQFGGRVIEFTGDGVMAAFGAASEAVRCASSLVRSARALGLELRAGVHTGEAYEVDDRLFGTCVTVASRVANEAAGGEILATETVQDLVVGAGLTFEPAGRVELKGLGERSLVRVCLPGSDGVAR